LVVSFVSRTLGLTRDADGVVKNLVLVGFANIEIVSFVLLLVGGKELISRSTWILSIYLI
jgi:hypothetical protein